MVRKKLERALVRVRAPVERLALVRPMAQRPQVEVCPGLPLQDRSSRSR